MPKKKKKRKTKIQLKNGGAIYFNKPYRQVLAEHWEKHALFKELPDLGDGPRGFICYNSLSGKFYRGFYHGRGGDERLYEEIVRDVMREELGQIVEF